MNNTINVQLTPLQAVRLAELMEQLWESTLTIAQRENINLMPTAMQHHDMECFLSIREQIYNQADKIDQKEVLQAEGDLNKAWREKMEKLIGSN